MTLPMGAIDNKMGIHQKIFDIMSEFKYVKMKGRIAYKDTKYDYLSEEQITKLVHKELIAKKVIMHPYKLEVLANADHTKTTVNITYRFIDIEDGSFINVSVIGKGKDNQDKDAGKAMTGAFKYAQRQTFHISTGKDPDQNSSDEMDAEEKKLKVEVENLYKEGKEIDAEESKKIVYSGKDRLEKIEALRKLIKTKDAK